MFGEYRRWPLTVRGRIRLLLALLLLTLRCSRCLMNASSLKKLPLSSGREMTRVDELRSELFSCFHERRFPDHIPLNLRVRLRSLSQEAACSF